ncbi:ATP-binding protein [Stakelama tenebrarum]|uniref:histidine kinase n=1 Tax=Stakelama tenebrarum TaxID=2711215 RepID=A0A6G6Y3J1_9SPHN|nr:ATP-binding protein [Sphingosinithalassobacter tenebrarum]QIG79485.1 ATPase [Sphingosinithalassobacter tenebrarum]
MEDSAGKRVLAALGLAAMAAFASMLVNGDIEASLVVLVCAVAAVLVGAGMGDAMPELPPAPPPAPPQQNPPLPEVIEAIIEPVLVISEQRVTAANRAACALLGEHILQQDVRLAIRHPAASERLLSPGKEIPGAPIHLVGLGTRDQRWEMRIRTLSSGERIVHLVDRTGSYAADRMRVDFVANASHELRTPLASLLGYVETLGEEAGEDRKTRKRFLDVMHNEAKRMQRLVDDLISLSRIEAEKYREPDQSVDLGVLIEQVRNELTSMKPERGADLKLDLRPAPPVRGDHAQLSQLLHNIVSNAMKYGRPGTPVEISLESQRGGMVRLRVCDHGEGIDPDHLPRLTERFYRIDSSRSRAMGGTGLGLAIVKHIVERHRGRLDIASQLGEGTQVTILLPEHRLS